MRSLDVMVRWHDDRLLLVKVDADVTEPGCQYARIYEVAPGVWRETLTNVTWPG